jgi:serine protease Do
LVVALVLGVQFLAAAWAGPPAATVAPPKSVDELRTLEARARQAVVKRLPCVVAIRLAGGQGSGVIVSRDGYVATAGHLIDKPGEKATFVTADGKTHTGVALGADRNVDSGLMKLDGDGPWPFVELGSCEGLALGTWCVAIGHPFGFQEERAPVVRIGRVLNVQPQTLRSDCAIVAGDSGGPLFDLDGKLLAIHSRIGAAVTMNFHVPIDVYRSDWETLKAGRLVQENLPVRDAAPVKALLAPLAAGAAACVVQVRSDGRDAALGTIVGPQGWVLTKASEARGRLMCKLRDGRELEARLVGVDPQFDLAMLKLDTDGLALIAWSTALPEVGQWVVAPGMSAAPLAVGVASVPARRIPPPSGALGIVLDDEAGAVKILKVFPKSPAERAGVKANDQLLRVNGRAVANRDDAVASVKRFRPGEAVRLGLKRGEQTLELKATLGTMATPGALKRIHQNTMGGSLSLRRDDFPRVLQHDGVLQPAECGGPLVDLSGKVIGVNIARAGRTETYAIPSDVLLGRMYELMSGRLAPPKTQKRPATVPPSKPTETRPSAKQAS